MKDIDIQRMDKKSLKEYLYSLIVTKKKTQKAMERAKDELNRWENRLKLAKEKGERELTEAASVRVEENKMRVQSLTAELEQLKSDIEQLKSVIKNSIDFKRSVDVDLLLEELKLLTGDNSDDE